MLKLEMLPAAHDDAVWLEYGAQRRPRRIVIDGGPAACCIVHATREAHRWLRRIRPASGGRIGTMYIFE